LTPSDAAIPVDYPAMLEREFPREFAIAWPVVESLLAAVANADLSPLARHSPGLQGYDWTAYLRCSAIRMVRALHALNRAGATAGRVLDVGAYFGNFSLMCLGAGYAVDALDSYRAYGPALERCERLVAGAGGRVLDFADTAFDLSQLAPVSYDIVICAGVIEHLPHTPRPLLEAIDRVLAPSGMLLIDTPNQAYLYNRQRLMRGESIMAPLASQYPVEPPFEGHHREFTVAEIRWMVERLGHDLVALDTFNYSLYALSEISGNDLVNYRQMEADPTMREIILSLSRKPRAAGAAF
jgi:SAM-dependent methyltransferase